MSAHAKVIVRSDHCVSRADISKRALKVLYTLHDAGYDAYLVGGGVRDLLLGLRPKDYDVVTNATPEEVRQLFRNSRIIGKRFRLVHVYFRGEIVEVATYRAMVDEASLHHQRSDAGMILRDNVYGNIAEDAIRRDFTINALYYNIADFSVVDFVAGIDDLKKRTIRFIGDPEQRYQEDPVRILRAIRHKAKLDFEIDVDTEKPIKKLSGLLSNISSARLYDEVLKLFYSGYAEKSFNELMRYHIFTQLFPHIKPLLGTKDSFSQVLYRNACKTIDQRHAQKKSLNPAYLFAVLLWPVYQSQLEDNINNGMKFYPAQFSATEHVLRQNQKHIAIPRRFSNMVREIWYLQITLVNRRRKNCQRAYHHPRFRAAYDFLLLRNDSGESLQEVCDWWTKYQEVSPKQREQMIQAVMKKSKKQTKS